MISKFWKDYGYVILISSLFVFLIILVYVYYARYKSKHKKAVPTPLPYFSHDTKEALIKGSAGERECRKVLEKIFNKPFTCQRPDFLQNDVTSTSDKKNNLELDCYNQELALAVEYNGRQHYDYVPFFHKTRDAFYNQKYRDEMKRRLCKENNVTLIEVPYSIQIKDIEDYLTKVLKELKLIK